MRARITVLLAPLVMSGVLLSVPVAAQPPAAAKPKWAAAHDLQVRKGKDTDWDKAPKQGVEAFEDPAAGSIVAINSVGNMAVATPDAVPNKKKADWSSALSFSVRTASEDKFSNSTALFGVEVFKNAFAGRLLYISERAGLALFQTATATGDKDPEFQYGLTLRVRKPGQTVFGPDAKAFGMEAYKDNNTGGLVYVTEGGMLAVAAAVPEKAPETKDVKKPKPLYGLECRVRKADEADFTDKTQKYGVEVFQDQNTGTLIYISETGSIAAVPPPAEIKKDQKLSWMHAMTLKARPGGEADFAKARKFGIEVFTDMHTGYVVYVNETGSIAVLAAKK
jgi:hypothetical protein